MITTIYQKFVSRYAEIFTMVEMTEGDSCQAEIVPAAKVAKMDKYELEGLLAELRHYECEKASWGEDDSFDEEDARTAFHQRWEGIDQFMDERGL